MTCHNTVLEHLCDMSQYSVGALSQRVTIEGLCHMSKYSVGALATICHNINHM